MHVPAVGAVFVQGAEDAGGGAIGIVLQKLVEAMKFREAAVAGKVVRVNLGFRRFAQGFKALCLFGKILPEGGIGDDGGGRIILQVQHRNALVQVVQAAQHIIQPVGFFCFPADGNMGQVDLKEVAVFSRQGRNVVPCEMHVAVLFRIGDGLVLSGAEDIEEKGVNVPAQGRGRTVQLPFRMAGRAGAAGSQGLAEFMVCKEVGQLPFIEFYQSHGLIGEKIDGTQGVVVIFKGPVLRNPSFFLHAVFQFRKRHGFAVVPSLDFLASYGADKLQLLFRFHPFHQGVDADVLGHAYRGFDNALCFFRKAGEEGHIDLDFIEMVIFQHVQGRIAAAEVVHPHFIAGVPEFVDLGADADAVLDEDAFRDFHMNHMVGHPVLPDDGVHFFKNRAAVEIDAGQVEGNRNHRQSLAHSGAVSFADFFQHIEVQLLNLAAFLQGRNEIGRRKESVYRIHPPGQGFGAGKGAGNGADHRLQVDFDVLLIQGFLQMVHDIALDKSLFTDGFGIGLAVDIISVPDAVGGSLG